MSDLTLSLLERKPSRRAKQWQARVAAITDLLVAQYGTPSLGNFRNPVKAIFYIVLSARTTESLYKEAHKQLFERFPTLQEIANAPLAKLRACVAVAGLGKKRAEQIKRIAGKLLSDFGKRSTARLRGLSAMEAYSYLRTLSGVGPKSALCIMMYSLGFDVFPVDTHAHRMLCRIGLMPSGRKHYHAQIMLPAFVPPNYSNKLHVALILHGRRICKSRLPHCSSCELSIFCKYATKHFVAAHSIP